MTYIKKLKFIQQQLYNVQNKLYIPCEIPLSHPTLQKVLNKYSEIFPAWSTKDPSFDKSNPNPLDVIALLEQRQWLQDRF